MEASEVDKKNNSVILWELIKEYFKNEEVAV